MLYTLDVTLTYDQTVALPTTWPRLFAEAPDDDTAIKDVVRFVLEDNGFDYEVQEIQVYGSELGDVGHGTLRGEKRLFKKHFTMEQWVNTERRICC